MAKNIGKINVSIPYDLSVELPKYVKSNLFMKEIKIHFDSKINGGSLYVDKADIPEYIFKKTESFYNYYMYAASVKELQLNLKDLFEAYLKEYSNIETIDKIAFKIYNSFNSENYMKELKISRKINSNVSIEVFLLKEKKYFNKDGECVKVIYVEEKDQNNIVKTEGYEIINYSEEALRKIEMLQNSLYNKIKDFKDNLGTGEELENNLLNNGLIQIGHNQKG